VKVTVQGLVNPRLDDLTGLFEYTDEIGRAAAEAIDEVFTSHEKKLFDSEGQHGGAKWDPLSPRYKKWKDRQFAKAAEFNLELARTRGRRLTSKQLQKAIGSENKVLQLTGVMMRAFSVRGSKELSKDGEMAEHVSEHFKTARGWTIRTGARGPKYFSFYSEDSDVTPLRNSMLHTDEQWQDYIEALRKPYAHAIIERLKFLHQRRGRFVRA
jgi:hypothetical protein